MSRQPLAVCWGMGQDSTGMLVGMWERGIRPQLVITADVGSERPETYAFRPIFDDWLESVGFPRSVIGPLPTAGLQTLAALLHAAGKLPHQCDAAQPGLRLPHLFREVEDRPHQRLHLRSFLGEGMVGRRREDTQGDRF